MPRRYTINPEKRAFYDEIDAMLPRDLLVWEPPEGKVRSWGTAMLKRNEQVWKGRKYRMLTDAGRLFVVRMR